MSPEYNFHFQLNLPSDDNARAVGRALSRLQDASVIRIINPLGESVPLEPTWQVEGMSFSRTYRLFRQSEGLGQREIARRTGMNPATINRIEIGDSNRTPRADSVARLVRALRLDRDDARVAILLKKAAAENERDGDILLMLIGQI